MASMIPRADPPPFDQIGYLATTERLNAFGDVEALEYSLGPPERAVKFVRISGQYIREHYEGSRSNGVNLRIGPYRLLLVGQNYPEDRDGLYAIDDGLPSRLRVWWYRFTPGVRLFKSRIIATLAIWGLARWAEMGDMPPPWRDVYAVDWIARRFGR